MKQCKILNYINYSLKKFMTRDLFSLNKLYFFIY